VGPSKKTRSRSKWPTLESIHTIVFDFDGVFTDNTVLVNQDGVESVRCSRADGLGIEAVQHLVELVGAAAPSRADLAGIERRAVSPD